MWRVSDMRRNTISLHARKYLTPKNLEGMSCPEVIKSYHHGSLSDAPIP